MDIAIIAAIISGTLALLGSIFAGLGTNLLVKDPKKILQHETANASGAKIAGEGYELQSKDNRYAIKRFRKICLCIVWISLAIVLILFIFLKISSTPPKNEVDAFLWYVDKAEHSKNPEINNGLGECYYFGRGTDIDYDKAFDCFQKAAGNNVEACYNLALCYTYGRGTELDDENALKYFTLAEKEIPDAKAYVGYYNYCGWGGIDVDKTAAMEKYKLSQQDGSVMSLYFQGIYTYNNNVNKLRLFSSSTSC